MLTAGELQPWKSWQKILFRFLFLFLGFFLLNFEFAILLIDLNLYKSVAKIYGYLAQPLHWLDKHIYHLGYNPKLHDSVPGDNHFGIVFYLSLIIVAGLIVIAWSIIDRHKMQYNKLNSWFRIYIRYMVALLMFDYGIEKFFPVQMGFPGIADLLTPYGNQDLFSVLWNFLGSSPGYEMFTGVCEIIGSLLLIFRRTYVFGSLFMCAVLSNVVALNIFYNISVKMYSSLLLLSVFYLLAPFLSKLAQFFFAGKSISLIEKRYQFERRWKKYVVISLGICIPLLSGLYGTYIAHQIYTRYKQSAMNQKLYDVTYFITKDTLPPLLTDSLRWKRFAFTSRKTVSVYSMQDHSDPYDCDMDTSLHTCRLHDNPDSAKWDVFHYFCPQKNLLQFTGPWKGTNVTIVMKEVPIDSMNLKKERIAFLND